MPDDDLPEESAGDRADGWAAIDAALRPIYGEQEPLHWGTLIKYRLGGPDPLDGISAYRHDLPPAPPHWHFVTYGMSELYAKELEDADVSGWGFEFSFRLARNPQDDQPPMWPLNLLNNLARYVCDSGNVFAPGHYLPFNAPIATSESTALHAALFAEDPELKTIDTPNGKMQFLQIVGVTLDELAAARAWNVQRFLEVLAARHPLLVTDMTRASILGNASIAATIAQRTALEGSSSGGTAISQLELSSADAPPPLVITIGANAVADLQALLRGRIPFNRPFRVRSASTIVRFLPAPSLNVTREESTLTVELPSETARSLADSLRPQRGDYPVPTAPHLLVRVIPTDIKDATGEKIIETIG
ncbi:MAG TPA: suppressor of fused domain protein [Phycisphaerae bacterium]|nr:suppressor of fused domain protein [Phycisphaerae bacterium]